MKFLPLILLLVVGCGPINGGHVSPVKPAPVETIEQAADSSFVAYRQRLAAVFGVLAREIKAKKITSDEQLADRMEELTKTERIESFAPFRAAWSKQAVRVTEWDEDERAERCLETERGFAR